jgi:hypothetical protein
LFFLFTAVAGWVAVEGIVDGGKLWDDEQD